MFKYISIATEECGEYSNDTSALFENNYYRRLFDARIEVLPSLEQGQTLDQITATFCIKSEITLLTDDISYILKQYAYFDTMFIGVGNTLITSKVQIFRKWSLL